MAAKKKSVPKNMSKSKKVTEPVKKQTKKQSRKQKKQVTKKRKTSTKKRSNTTTKPPIDIEKERKALESAVIKSLEIAYMEREVTKSEFKEESLRYIVLSQISQKQLFGKFPNKQKGKILVMQHTYERQKKKNAGVYYPDIASLKLTPSGNISKSMHPLAIELKIHERIKEDINKSRDYLNKRGKQRFRLCAVVSAGKKAPKNLPPKAKISNLLVGYLDEKGKTHTRWI